MITRLLQLPDDESLFLLGPRRERSKVISLLLEREISARENSLYLCAKSLEEMTALKAETVIWDQNFSQDGLDNV